MTVYTLFPSYVQVFYHSPWGVHVQTLPTLQWEAGAGSGSFLTHAAGSIDADVMINAFIDVWLTLFTTEIVFDYYTIFNFADEDALPVPVASAALGQTGSAAPGSLTNKAVQVTISWQCVGGFLLKTVGLDANAPVDFTKLGPTELAAAIPTIIAEVTDDTNAWASRAGTKPLFPKQAAYTLNEKLRRSYHEN